MEDTQQIIETPDNKEKLFTSIQDMIDFLSWRKPTNFQVVTGYMNNGTYVMKLTYSNGDHE